MYGRGLMSGEIINNMVGRLGEPSYKDQKKLYSSGWIDKLLLLVT